MRTVIIERGRSRAGTVGDGYGAQLALARFHDLFRLDRDWRTIVNWGLAAVVYSFIGRLLAGFVAR